MSLHSAHCKHTTQYVTGILIVTGTNEHFKVQHVDRIPITQMLDEYVHFGLVSRGIAQNVSKQRDIFCAQMSPFGMVQRVQCKAMSH